MLDHGVLRRASGFLLFIAGMAFHSIAVARPPVPPPSPPEDLVPGQAIIRTVWRKNLRFVFDGSVGDVITLEVTSQTSGLDPHVALMDPEDVEETSDDDGGGHGNCLIKEHALKQTGVYTVLVGSDGEERGEVEILLTKAPPPSSENLAARERGRP